MHHFEQGEYINSNTKMIGNASSARSLWWQCNRDMIECGTMQAAFSRAAFRRVHRVSRICMRSRERLPPTSGHLNGTKGTGIACRTIVSSESGVGQIGSRDLSNTARQAESEHAPASWCARVALNRKENDVLPCGTHHLTGDTIHQAPPVLLQLQGLVLLLLLQMRTGTSYDRYHHSWAHPAILPYNETCTTARWRVFPFVPPPRSAIA